MFFRRREKRTVQPKLDGGRIEQANYVVEKLKRHLNNAELDTIAVILGIFSREGLVEELAARLKPPPWWTREMENLDEKAKGMSTERLKLSLEEAKKRWDNQEFDDTAVKTMEGHRLILHMNAWRKELERRDESLPGKH